MGLETSPSSARHGEDQVARCVCHQSGHSGAVVTPLPAQQLQIHCPLGVHCMAMSGPSSHSHGPETAAREWERGRGLSAVLQGRGRGLGGVCSPGLGAPGIQDLKPQVLPALLLHQLPGTSAQCAQVQVEGTKSPTDRNCLSTGSVPGCGDPGKNQKQQQRSGTCPATPSPDQKEPRGNPDKGGCFPGQAASWKREASGPP